MKRTFYSSLLLCALLSGSSFGQSTVQSESSKKSPSPDAVVYFPDSNFRNTIFELNVDENRDGLIQYRETAQPGSLQLSGRNIADLQGIEAFTSLRQLSISNNRLTSLDLRSNRELTELIANFNMLSEVKFSKNGKLTILSLAYNELTSINLKGLADLKLLELSQNRLTRLDLSGNTSLSSVRADNNPVEHVNFGGIRNLVRFDVNGTNLENVNLRNLEKLEELYLSGNKLKSLDISKNSALRDVYVLQPSLAQICISAEQEAKALSWYKDPATTWVVCRKQERTESTETVEDKANIFPVPASGFISVTSSSTVREVIIRNQMGQEQLRSSFADKIDISALPQGVYIAEITTEDDVLKRRFTVR